MNSLRLILAFGAVASLLSACTLLEPGGPSAARTITARSAFQVKDVVERVFVDEGYQPTLRTADGITFERKASRADQVFYGDWIGGEITQRVKVTVTPRGEERFRVGCIPYIVRDPHDISFEDQHRRMQIFSFHYASLLREVRRQCRELYLSRSPVESD
jgi:hypothetical protein